MFQIFPCLSFSILQKKNWYIWYIINKIPIKFWLIKWFEVTFIKKWIFCLTHIFIRSDWTCTYIHSIIYSSYINGCTTILFFYFNYWSQFNNNSHTWGIFYLSHYCTFHSSMKALSVKFQFVDVFSNPRGRINNSIL